MQTLLIIDMQEEFEAACVSWVIKGCQREIQAAIARNEPVIVLEYRTYCPTLPAITNQLKNYKQHYTCSKRQDSGANAVMRLVKATQSAS